MGDILLRDGWVTGAELLYRKAGDLVAKFDKSPTRKDNLVARMFSGLSLVEEARGNWSASQKQLESWLKYDPRSSIAMQRLARCLFQEKNAAAALEWLEAAKGNSQCRLPKPFSRNTTNRPAIGKTPENGSSRP